MLRWLYFDLNSFFASCEQQEKPDLRGRPVAVVPLMSDSTCAIAASYEAKAFGVKTGTNVGEAKKMCPGLVLVQASHRRYVQYHHRVLKAVETCLPIDSVRSIDEVACRLTGDQQQTEVALALGARIKKAVLEQAGECLTASVGLAPNLFLSKVASDMQKPDGLTALTPDVLPHALHALKLRDLPGIGPRMERRLWQNKIYDVKTLLGISALQMRAIWGGVGGLRFYGDLHGEDWAGGTTTARCIGHQHVLEPVLRTHEGGLQVCVRLLEKAAERLRAREYYCKHLSVNVKLSHRAGYFENGVSFHESQDTSMMLRELKRLWRTLPVRAAPLRVGVTLSGLVPATSHQEDLFTPAKPAGLLKAIDALNLRYGRGTVHFGQDARTTGAGKDKIAFQRVPALHEL